MAEAKVRVTDGTNTMVVPVSTYEAMLASRPAYMPPLTISTDKVDAVFRNEDGELVREFIPPEQVKRRARFGQGSVATPDRIEAHRKESVERQRLHQAEGENLLTFVQASIPGMQHLQNLAVGKDEAAQARQELGTNTFMNMGGNLAELALLGGAAGVAAKGILGAQRAAKLGTFLGLGKQAGVIRKGLHVGGIIALEDTHFYTQQLLDTNSEFVAEDWANSVAQGMLIGSPFIFGAAARAGGHAVRRAIEARGGLSGSLSTLGDAMTTAAVLSPKGGGKSMVYARGAAAAHVSGRVLKKVFPKKKGAVLGASEDIAKQQARHLDDMNHVGKTTPEGLDRMSPSKRRAHLERFEELADGASGLNEIKYGTIVSRARKMGSKAEGIRTQVMGIHRRFRGKGNKIRMTQTARNQAIAEANILMKYVEEAGLADVKGALQRGILAGGASGEAMHMAFMEARINARFRRGVSGGADVVDDALKRFTEDETIWGALQAKRNRTINAAIEDTVKIWDDLGDLQIPKHFEDVTINDGLHITKAHGSYDRLRANMDLLEHEGLLTREQVRGIETKLVEADAAMRDGAEAYIDVIRINKARQAAAGKLAKEGEVAFDIPTSQESFAAEKGAMVAETAASLMKLASKGLDALLSPVPMIAAATGVTALRNLDPAEKYEAFAEIQDELYQLTGNPEYAMAKLGTFMDRGAAYDPAGVQEAGNKIVNTLYWLTSQLPKPDDTIYGRQAPQPLSMVEEFLEKYVSAYDPVSVGHASLEGRVTPGMVDAIRVTNPAMYAEMNVIFAEMLAKAPARDANPIVLAGIGQFLGTVDPTYTGDFIMQLQSTYAQTTTQQGVIQGGVNNMPNPQPGSGNSAHTTSQRQQA